MSENKKRITVDGEEVLVLDEYTIDNITEEHFAELKENGVSENIEEFKKENPNIVKIYKYLKPKTSDIEDIMSTAVKQTTKEDLIKFLTDYEFVNKGEEKQEGGTRRRRKGKRKSRNNRKKTNRRR